GSTRIGYSRSLSSNRATTVHLGAPGGVTARPHGSSALVSTEQPSTSSVPSRVWPEASTTAGAFVWNIGSPVAERTSSTRCSTSRRPPTFSIESSYLSTRSLGGAVSSSSSSVPSSSGTCTQVPPAIAPA